VAGGETGGVVMRPRLLDLFCGAGGAGMGYHRAGFDVVGVDINPQPRYPFEFHQADAMTWPLDGYDAIHASPPCQAYTSMRNAPNTKRGHPDLVAPIRQRLTAAGVPWVIENVPGSPIDVRPPDLFGYPGAIMLCGSMFGLGTDIYQLRRHRWFEASCLLDQPSCQHDRPVLGVYGGHARDRRRTIGLYGNFQGREKCGIADARAVMGINWMTSAEISQAIPPAYTEFIGHALLDVLERAA
jgi:DNA (cytosine-5)-methyltransferase 1